MHRPGDCGSNVCHSYLGQWEDMSKEMGNEWQRGAAKTELRLRNQRGAADDTNIRLGFR